MIHHLHRHAWIYTRQSVLGWSNRKANGDPLFSKNIGPAKHTLPCVDQSDQPEVEKTGDQKANGVALLLLRYPMSIEPNKNYVLGSMEVEQRMVWDQICQKLQIGPCDIRTYWVTRWFQPIFKRYSSTWKSSPNRDEHDKLPWNYDVANVLCGICHGYIEEISKSEVSEIQQDLSTSILPLWVYQRFQSMNVTAELNLFLSIFVRVPKAFQVSKNVTYEGFEFLTYSNCQKKQKQCFSKHTKPWTLTVIDHLKTAKARWCLKQRTSCLHFTLTQQPWASNARYKNIKI